jgi:methionine-rich copper-binding protein CopC
VKTRPVLALLAVVLALTSGFAGARSGDAAEALHLRLERSAPAADSAVTSPSEIRLWFSQSTQEGATSIRLLDSAGEPVPTGRVEGSEDDTVHAAPVEHELESGRYTVAWRTMAQDGHVIRGDFEFTVRSAEAPEGSRR